MPQFPQTSFYELGSGDHCHADPDSQELSAPGAVDGSYAKFDAPGELHAHTEAYMDGHRVVMDAAWDSLNKYSNSEYLTKASSGYL